MPNPNIFETFRIPPPRVRFGINPISIRRDTGCPALNYNYTFKYKGKDVKVTLISFEKNVTEVSCSKCEKVVNFTGISTSYFTRESARLYGQSKEFLCQQCKVEEADTTNPFFIDFESTMLQHSTRFINALSGDWADEPETRD